jgi:DNA-binding CsgD family transcriptional regulator
MDAYTRQEILSRYRAYASQFDAVAAARRTQPDVPVPTLVPRPTMQPSATGRELDVLQLMSDGLTNREIARRLSISEETAKTHVRNILAKFHAASRAHAVSVGFRAELVA